MIIKAPFRGTSCTILDSLIFNTFLIKEKSCDKGIEKEYYLTKEVFSNDH
jgi:hypothetical protein